MKKKMDKKLNIQKGRTEQIAKEEERKIMKAVRYRQLVKEVISHVLLY